MSEYASSSASSPASTVSEETTRKMSDVVADMDTEQLIDYLQRRDLKLTKPHFEKLRKEEIAGSDFIEMNKDTFQSIGFALGPAMRLAKFVESLDNKLRTYSSYKTLGDLKLILQKNKVNGENTTTIKQFKPGLSSEL